MWTLIEWKFLIKLFHAVKKKNKKQNKKYFYSMFLKKKYLYNRIYVALNCFGWCKSMNRSFFLKKKLFIINLLSTKICSELKGIGDTLTLIVDPNQISFLVDNEITKGNISIKSQEKVMISCSETCKLQFRFNYFQICKTFSFLQKKKKFF